MSKLKALGVFCGADIGNDPIFANAASQLGEELGKRKLELVFGYGLKGIMGALVRQAKISGARIVGVITKHLFKFEHSSLDVDELIVVSSMQIRKDIMFNRADAFCVLPGGFGTLDELFEIITLRQIGEMNKPIIIANIDGFWSDAEALLLEVIKRGFAQEKHKYLFTMVDKIEDVIPTIEKELDTLEAWGAL